MTFLRNMLGDFQTSILCFWLSVALKALRTGQRMPGQALAIIGPVNVGKSLLQKLITLILGGRVANPFQYMSGGTAFNSDMFGAEHLQIEDEAASSSVKSRERLGSLIKMVTVNEYQRCHGKGRDPFILCPQWRLTISCNDDQKALAVLPPLTPGVSDKITLLKAQYAPMPMPTGTPDQRKAFWNALVSELPELCLILLILEIPEYLQSSRFGVTHYHNPEILQLLDILQPEMRLHEIINDHFGSHAWNGSAAELMAILTSTGCAFRVEAANLLRGDNVCGRYLAELAKKYPDSYVRGERTGSKRTWHISPVVTDP